MKSFVAAALLGFATTMSAAQMVVQAEAASLQPQIRRDDLGFAACGIRAVVAVPVAENLDVYDFSIMADSKVFAGTLKAGKERGKVADALQNKKNLVTVKPAPIRFWIALEREGKALTPNKIFPSETPGFILETADIVPTFRVIYAMMSRERMQFAMRYKEQKVDTVVTFASQLTEPEVSSLQACMDGIIERMQAEAERDMDK